MMTVLMDNGSAPPERELVQNLYKKNIELENGLRKSARSRVPSDPNTWLQMRENYETIILKDRDFSEKHEIEYALWQLHYRKIEEFRSHINVAVSGSVASQGGMDPVRPDRIKKIRSVFKSFLSEATGFYHDLILKIRSEYGLPLGYFSDSPESQIIRTKDEKRSYDMKKGLLSCHRCLVYLGDLARYKGLYGEGDTVSRDYVAATSYYLNAASLWPSSGNPHHQLAILASYSGDDLMSVYRYFRSLAVDNPFSTARDNLIIAFEKNRQNYSQLPGNTKVTSARTMPARSAGRGRGDTRIKDIKTETIPTKEHDLSIPELLKAFCVRFVRLNGILFTRTSLETFDEIFSLVISDLHALLRSGPEEELNFCQDVAESRLTIVRLITILIFTVHNVSRESEGQSYAEILQRSVLLQNAFTAAFEFSGHVLKRCLQLRDAASSFLLSAILVFMEWLACHPDIAAGCDVEEKQANARSFFWNQCISFLNKLILSKLGSVGGINQDENTFSDMIRYDDWDTGNRPALCEDFELRGFLPLVPAQVILDFSGNCSFESEGSLKEKRARVQRILAAGRALTDAVSVDQQGIYFDPKLNKFLFGSKPFIYEDEDNMRTGLSNVHESNSFCEGNLIESPFDLGVPQLSTGQVEMERLKESLYTGDDEEEEIVFKPMVAEKSSNLNASKSTAYEIIQPVHFSSKADRETFSAPLSSFNNIQMSTVLNASPLLHSHTPIVSQQPSQHVSRNTKKWLVGQETKLYNSLNTMNINGNDPLVKHGPQEATFQPSALFSAPPIMNSINAISGEMRVTEPVIPSTLDSIVPSGATCDSLTMKTFSALPIAARKSPVSRPVRHHGPPPGFTHVQPKQLDYPISHPLVDQNRQFDDFSWLDGYKSSSTDGMGMMYPSNYNGDYINNTDNDTLAGATTFLFPGKQTANVQTSVVKEQLWKDFQLFEHLNPYSEQKFQPANLTAASLPEHHLASSIWSNSNFL